MADRLDLDILDVLEQNSRSSFAEIGRAIGLSPSAVRERVQKLEDLKVIKRYVVDVDYRMLGYDIEAFISVKAFHGQLKPLFKVLPGFPEVKKAYRVTGGQNIHLHVITKDRLQLQGLIDQLMDYGDTLTQIVLSEADLTKDSQ